MTLDRYDAAIKQFRPGDLVVFQGDELISFAIHAETDGPSHVAVVRWPAGFDRDGKVIRDVEITQSTIEDGISGCQTDPLRETLAKYGAHSSAGLLRLNPECNAIFMAHLFDFYAYVGGCEGFVKYDLSGLFGFVARTLPVIGAHICQAEDPHRMFCSAYATGCYEATKVLRGFNVRKVAPIDLCQMKIWEPEIVQLLDRPLSIPRFNSV